MNFEWYLALRYFKGKRKDSRFLSFIKVMAISGVAIGSAGLLIALSIVHGFKSTINGKVLGFAPHITVSTFTDDPIYRSDTLTTYMDRFPGIEQMQPVVNGQAMIQSPDRVTGIYFKGVREEVEVTDLRSYIARGKYDLGKQEGGLPGIILGSALAEELDADIGTTLTAYTVEGIPSPLSSPEIQQFKLSGIYQTGIDRFDELFALVDRAHASKLFQMPGAHASLVELRLKDASQIEAFDEVLAGSLPFPYYTETIYDRYGNIFAWVDLQESTIPFVISVMIIVAAFNLIGTVLMMVLERTRDIGILKTMGTRNSKVRSIFLLEGLLVAVMGLVIGIGMAVLFNWLQATYHLIPLSEENYYMAYAPVEPHMLDFVLVIAVTVILCTLASWLPARIASRTDPLSVIAYGR